MSEKEIVKTGEREFKIVEQVEQNYTIDSIHQEINGMEEAVKFYKDQLKKQEEATNQTVKQFESQIADRKALLEKAAAQGIDTTEKVPEAPAQVEGEPLEGEVVPQE